MSSAFPFISIFRKSEELKVKSEEFATARAYPETFSLVLLEWFRENGRQLPWRETTDPYAIWLSEIILQQTRIEQGRPYWERFMSRWPRVEDLAAATEDEVLREWQGLVREISTMQLSRWWTWGISLIRWKESGN